MDHWLRDVGGVGHQAQDPGDRRSRGPKNRGDSEKQGESRKQGKRSAGSRNLEELGERGDPAGTRDPEPPPVSSANGATRITGEFIFLTPF